MSCMGAQKAKFELSGDDFAQLTDEHLSKWSPVGNFQSRGEETVLPGSEPWESSLVIERKFGHFKICQEHNFSPRCANPSFVLLVCQCQVVPSLVNGYAGQKGHSNIFIGLRE